MPPTRGQRGRPRHRPPHARLAAGTHRRGVRRRHPAHLLRRAHRPRLPAPDAHRLRRAVGILRLQQGRPRPRRHRRGRRRRLHHHPHVRRLLRPRRQPRTRPRTRPPRRRTRRCTPGQGLRPPRAPRHRRPLALLALLRRRHRNRRPPKRAPLPRQHRPRAPRLHRRRILPLPQTQPRKTRPRPHRKLHPRRRRRHRLRRTPRHQPRRRPPHRLPRRRGLRRRLRLLLPVPRAASRHRRHLRRRKPPRLPLRRRRTPQRRLRRTPLRRAFPQVRRRVAHGAPARGDFRDARRQRRVGLLDREAGRGGAGEGRPELRGLRLVAPGVLRDGGRWARLMGRAVRCLCRPIKADWQHFLYESPSSSSKSSAFYFT
mmetsp:Transcript_14013/g.37460  ORF Transcript_14013/g.37460 Transcript_14013/m.37460 type:complete len:371 (-) Transcript_14013:875-1987(-)